MATAAGATDPNAFNFSGDPNGQTTPLAAHIRKANPRDDQEIPHRILRRGIAYGESYREGADDAGLNGRSGDRGLQFLCYQASIEEQFEFLQQAWCNDPSFPPQPSGQGWPSGSAPGHDPIIGQTPQGGQCTMTLPGAGSIPIPRFVTTTGCLYLFQPSIAGLRHLAGATAAQPVAAS